MKNYRGITLLNTAYKIYASILNGRLKKKAEGRLSENQFGFREGRGAINAVYVLNHVINKEVGKTGGKIFTFFTDLKAAFNKIDREILRNRLREIKIRRKLRRKIEEIYKETKNVIKIGEERSETFWTHKGLRQESPEPDVI